MHPAQAALISAGVAWLAFVVVFLKGANLRVRLASIALGLIVLIGARELFRHAPALVNRVSHSMFYEVDLSWDAPPNSPSAILGYNVYRTASGSTSYQRLNSTVVAQTTYADTTVHLGQTYIYLIKSVNALNGIESLPSNESRATVPWIPHLLNRGTH